MITLAIPTYNRSDMVIESFLDILNEEKITEIIILDDFSNETIFNDLSKKISNLNSKKIKLFRNETNKGAFYNKLDAVKASTNQWVIVLDSDNKLTHEYLASIPTILENKTFYLPCRGICESKNLDYRKYANLLIEKPLYKKMATSDDSNLNCLFNTGNYLINKETYLMSVNNENEIFNPFALDPFYQIYLGFKNIKNFKLWVVDGMEYFHRLHKSSTNECGSFYTNNSYKSIEFSSFIKTKIMEL